MLSAETTAPALESLNTVVPLYLNRRSSSPVSSSISHLLEPNRIAFPFVSKSPPSCGVVSFTKSVGAARVLVKSVTCAPAPAPSA